MFRQTTTPLPPTTGRTRDPEATRERILACAFDEMYENGYAGASLDRILADSGVTKGALYHHFGSKADLAIAVIDEVIRPRFLELWADPVRGAEDPIAVLNESLRRNFAQVDDRFMKWGCPLNNLSQELSNADERIRTHLNGVFETARRTLADALEYGRSRGTVRMDTDPQAVAAFILATLEGLATTMKTSHDLQLTMAGGLVLLQFLDTLRAVPEHPAA